MKTRMGLTISLAVCLSFAFPAVTFLFFGGASGCGGGQAATSPGTPPTTPQGTAGLTITIRSFVFDPVNLEASPGATIHVVNDDAVVHTLTSESAPNAFNRSGEFDTGDLGPGQEADITVPANAVVGDQLFFYCITHKAEMGTPNGTITIVPASSSSTSAPTLPARPRRVVKVPDRLIGAAK